MMAMKTLQSFMLLKDDAECDKQMDQIENFLHKSATNAKVQKKMTDYFSLVNYA